jgi:hypothetical protein
MREECTVGLGVFGALLHLISGIECEDYQEILGIFGGVRVKKEVLGLNIRSSKLELEIARQRKGFIVRDLGNLVQNDQPLACSSFGGETWILGLI